MEFALSRDQQPMQDSLRNALTRACPLDRVRAPAARELASEPGVWSAVCELGMPLARRFKRIGLDRQLCGGPEQARRQAAVLQRLAA